MFPDSRGILCECRAVGKVPGLATRHEGTQPKLGSCLRGSRLLLHMGKAPPDRGVLIRCTKLEDYERGVVFAGFQPREERPRTGSPSLPKFRSPRSRARSLLADPAIVLGGRVRAFGRRPPPRFPGDCCGP